MNSITRVMIVGNFAKDEIRAYLRELEERLRKVGIEIVDTPSEADSLVVLGGDGTMLASVHEYRKFGKPFFGINFGHKGFLMNERNDKPVDSLIWLRFQVFSFALLDLTVVTKGGTSRDQAVNDVYVKPLRSAGSCKINVKIDGVVFAKNVMGDGIIASTALGSTAYNLSAGGSAVKAGLDLICLTPLNVHTPVQIKPTVWPADTTIDIDILEDDVRRAIAVCDGREYEDAKHVRIRQSRKRFKLALVEGQDFTERLVSKIMKVQ